MALQLWRFERWNAFFFVHCTTTSCLAYLRPMVNNPTHVRGF